MADLQGPRGPGQLPLDRWQQEPVREQPWHGAAYVICDPRSKGYKPKAAVNGYTNGLSTRAEREDVERRS